MVEFTNKREYLRIDINCELVYRFLNSNKFYKGFCVDLSGSGIAFTTHQSLALGSELEIAIYQPQAQRISDKPLLRAHVIVLRVKSLENQVFEIGASMTVLHNDPLSIN